MPNGTVVMICISPIAGQPMQCVEEVEAIAGAGLKGDRYAACQGSFSRGRIGSRQVTLMNARFFPGSRFKFPESRRNILTHGTELMYLIGREFQIGSVRLRGIKYNEPCNRPSKLANKTESFLDNFFDCGGIIAEILEGGIIKVNDPVISPPKDYEK